MKLERSLEAALEQALSEPTMAKAIAYICVWEHERILSGSATETCFEACIKMVMQKYPTPERKLIVQQVTALLNNDLEKSQDAVRQMVDLVMPKPVDMVPDK